MISLSNQTNKKASLKKKSYCPGCVYVSLATNLCQTSTPRSRLALEMETMTYENISSNKYVLIGRIGAVWFKCIYLHSLYGKLE